MAVICKIIDNWTEKGFFSQHNESVFDDKLNTLLNVLQEKKKSCIHSILGSMSTPNHSKKKN